MAVALPDAEAIVKNWDAELKISYLQAAEYERQFNFRSRHYNTPMMINRRLKEAQEELVRKYMNIGISALESHGELFEDIQNVITNERGQRKLPWHKQPRIYALCALGYALSTS